VSAKHITDKLARQLADELRARYGLDNDGMRALGSRLGGLRRHAQQRELEFGKRFTLEHRGTFDRLAK
jgi:hypothetical protein